MPGVALGSGEGTDTTVIICMEYYVLYCPVFVSFWLGNLSDD